MRGFKTALVSIDAPEIPHWVGEQITRQGIEFIARDCKHPDEVVEVAHDANLVWVFGGSRVVTAECLPRLKDCIAILRSGSGTDNIPVAQATELGIIVANTPQATCDTVSDHTIALLLCLVRNIVIQDRNVRGKKWNYKAIHPPVRLRGSTLGLIGFGLIARKVAEKLSGFELTFLAHDPNVDDEVFDSYGVRRVSLDELLSVSDFVSIHCPLKEDTFRLIGERALRRMKPSALLVNTARGAIIDEQALYRALKEGWIAGAALDVLAVLPNEDEQPLLELNNIILTPHMAGYVENHLDPFWEYSVKTVLDLANGRWPSSCVNPEVKEGSRLMAAERLSMRETLGSTVQGS